MTNEEFIQRYREDDVRKLALGKVPEGVDLRWCLQQIEGWQIARKKLPTWAQTEGLYYPVRLSMEQCSSEETAQYKRTIVERLIPQDERLGMVDLTGGLGVDFSFLAPLFQQSTYVEIQPDLCDLARHNMPLLGIKSEKFLNESSVTSAERRIKNNSSHFSPLTSHFTLLFLDPARRDTAGRKTVGIEDCTPNLLDLQDELLAHAQWVMVKLSPMLDITEALRQLHHVCEVHVVSVRGECKELLFVQNVKNSGDVSIHCVNLGADDDEMEVKSYFDGKVEKVSVDVDVNINVGGFLYEPNASILKAGIQDTLCERYGVMKLHPHSNLFCSDTLIPHFPGRRFRITGMSDFSKEGLKNLIGDLRQANLTVRNFPTTVEKLRRQLHIAEGGDTYLFATTLSNGQHALLRCQKA